MSKEMRVAPEGFILMSHHQSNTGSSPLSSHEIDGVRKEKERLTAVSFSFSFFVLPAVKRLMDDVSDWILLSSFSRIQSSGNRHFLELSSAAIFFNNLLIDS